ncbi:MAG: hypothetical protein WBD18_10620 [Phycisphaerae bacterium]
MPIRRYSVSAALALAAALFAAGCAPKAVRQPRTIGAEVLGALTPQALRDTYATPAFVVRDTQEGRYVAFQDTDLADDSHVDDSNLLIYAEGSGDTVEASRWTMHLLAESPHGFPERPDRLVVMLLKWSESRDVVAEHLNRPAQVRAAAVLNAMLEIHRRRHGPAGNVSVIGFSAGTRVTQLAFLGQVPEGEDTHPQGLAHTQNIVFLGSSMCRMDETPFAAIRGRFLSFVNPRDTHYGDRAPYTAPAGEKLRVMEVLKIESLLRHPNFGASVMGFHHLPTITSTEQFGALEAASASPGVLEAFRMVNVPVPLGLVPYNLFGDPVPNDDADDYLNLAPNHYTMVGRGPAGRTDTPTFKQYRAAAEEFVHEQVAAAATRGRLYRFDLEAQPVGANPVKIPNLLPWAIFTPAPGKQPPKEETAPEPAPEKESAAPEPPPDTPAD